ncbi:MAG: hypothetical protein QOC82_2061 [Frankiaceae bacterium]|jgi:hypothetical protein|nr:hypothetical protein [Frankiaceae bacterium]
MRERSGPPGPRRDLLRHPVVVAAGAYVLIRLLMLAAIVGTAQARGMHAAGRLTKADGYWYLLIANHGYGHVPPIGPDGAYTHTTPLAFFPLYPWLIRAISVVGIPKLYAALLITAVAGTIAAVLITLWARPLVGDRGAVVLTVVWSLLPTSAVLDMAYSEALFVAAAAATLLALQRHRLIAAGLACTVAGLTRPTAAGLVLGVLIAIALDVRRTALGPRHLAAALLAPTGLLFSLGHVAVATGRLDGWFWLERTAWHSGFDGGWSWLRAVGQIVTGGRAAHQPPVVMSAAVVIAFLAAFVVWVRRRPPAAEVAYTAMAGLMAIGERNYVHVKPRFLLVAFPVLVPLARRMSRWPTSTLLWLAVPVLAASLAWNAYLVVVWPKSV